MLLLSFTLRENNSSTGGLAYALNNTGVNFVSNTNNTYTFSGTLAQFNAWMGERLERNRGFDLIAREVISGVNEVPGEGNPSGFARLKDSKPENLAAGTARSFLGLRLECAQCHNHPFESITQTDYYSLAASFAV